MLRHTYRRLSVCLSVYRPTMFCARYERVGSKLRRAARCLGGAVAGCEEELVRGRSVGGGRRGDTKSRQHWDHKGL